MNDTSIIIAAAGASSRMKSIDKQLALINSIPVIIKAIMAFETCSSVLDIIVVTTIEKIPIINSLLSEYNINKVQAVIVGDKTRQASVLCGLNSVSKESKFIGIHDGARPLIAPCHIENVIKDARVFGGATLGVPIKDTIKIVNDGLIVDTPDRSKIYTIQTPQVFKKSIYYDAVNFALANNLDFTDDCQLVEAMGIKICLTAGSYKNIKITTPEDLIFANCFTNEGEQNEY